METIKTVLISAVIAALVAGGLFVVLPKDSSGTPTLGALASPEVLTYLRVSQWFSEGGGVSTITPVAATHTITSAEMTDYNVLTFTASTTMPALTVTTAASTTFPLDTKPGSMRRWVIENPFTAAATTTTIAAGTGVDLQEPDGQNVVIGINNYAFLTCFRELSSDIVCSVDETIPAD